MQYCRRYLSHKTEEGAAAEVVQIWKSRLELCVTQPQPSTKSPSILLHGYSRYQSTIANVILLIRSNNGPLTINVAPFYRSTHHNMVIAPAMICAVAVGR